MRRRKKRKKKKEKKKERRDGRVREKHSQGSESGRQCVLQLLRHRIPASNRQIFDQYLTE